MIQQYTRPLDSERHEVKRFSGIGRPLTRVLVGPSGPINVKVYGANEDYLIDVESWESHPAGPITVRAPTVPIRLSDTEQRWDLKEGSLYVAELPMDDLYHNDFRRNFEAACRCTVRDRHLTWINGQKALRLSFEQPIASRITYGTLWAMPVGDKLIAINGFQPREPSRKASRHGTGYGSADPRRTESMIIADERNPKAQAYRTELLNRCPEQADREDLNIVIGGDGFLLRTIFEHNYLGTFLGLNAGHLGFLLNDVQNWDTVTHALGADHWVSYPFPLLKAEVTAPDGQVLVSRAINDVYVQRTTGHAAHLALSINGERVVEPLVSDGVIFATALGSTAYTYSAGGLPVTQHSKPSP